jgi:tetratricopeptide (TPR) repeat protein
MYCALVLMIFRFTRIIFIDASSQKQVEADLETAIRSVGPEWSKATWKDAVSYLSKDERWLLFFDNADDADLRLEPYLPNSKYGVVLITTRNRDFVGYSPDSHIQVGELSETEAIQLLHKVANVDPSSYDASISIVKELGMLALAVTQAAAYIFKTGQLNNYLAILRKHRDELMRDGSLQGRNYHGSTYAAFDLSFRLLPKKTQEVMKICAFLHYSLIPHSLFKISTTSHFRSYVKIEGYPPLAETESLVSNLEDIFGVEWDDFVFQKLIDPIMRGSLMDSFTSDFKSVFYNIHPLIQTYVQDQLEPSNLNRYGLLVGQLLLGAIRPSEDGTILNRQLVSHIDSLPTGVRQAHICHGETFADVYYSVGRWRACLSQREYCQIQFERELGDCHPKTISSKLKLGRILRECGDLKEAEEAGRKALELGNEILGPRNLDTISAMNNLAFTLGDSGQLEEAEKMKREVLELRMEILGSRHPGTVSAMGSLAWTLYELGKLKEAEKMNRDVLELRKEILGSRHPHTISAILSLAWTVYELGKLKEANKLSRDALELRKEILGNRHPHIVSAILSVAWTLYELGEWEEAEKMNREALKLQKESLGPQHTVTIIAAMNLAATIHECGRLEEAEKIQRETLKIQNDIQGTRHPDTIITLHNLAATLNRRGRLESAEKIQREVIALRNEILGPRHPKTISGIGNLACTLYDRGQLEESEKAQRQVLELRMEILGLRHHHTITAMHNLACVLAEKGQLEEAEKISRGALALRMEILGLQHPHTVSIIHNLANMLGERGQVEEAEELKRRIPEHRKETLGPRRFNAILIML